MYSICFNFPYFKYEALSCAVSESLGQRVSPSPKINDDIRMSSSSFSVDAWFAPNHLYSHQEEELCRVWNFLNFLSSTPLDLVGGGGGEVGLLFN